MSSKVYYHLEEYQDALRLALESGHYFDMSQRNLFIDTIIAKSIDEYIRMRRQSQLSKN